MVDQTKDSSQIFHLFITWRCDGKCPGCLYTKKVRKQGQHMSLETETAIVKKIGQYHLVSMAGGEPTIHPRFWQMVEGILAKEPVALRLVTNGFRLSRTPEAAIKWFSRMDKLSRKHNVEVSVIMSVGDPHAEGLKGGAKEMRQRIKTVKSALPRNADFNFNFLVDLVPKQSKTAAIRKYGLPRNTPVMKWQKIPVAGSVQETVIDPRGNVYATEAALFEGKKPLGNIRKNSMAALQKRRRGRH